MRHVGLLKRYTNRVCVCLDFDANQSGQRGQADSLLLLAQYGFSISKIDLPVGVDPDQLLIKEGIVGLKSLERPVTAKDLQEMKEKKEERRNARR
jgi:DNA primase